MPGTHRPLPASHPPSPYLHIHTTALIVPPSAHLRGWLTLTFCGGCSFEGLGYCSGRVCVLVSGVLFSVGVCVCVTY